MPKRAPRPEVVEICEDALRRARTGEITGIAWVAALSNGNLCEAYAADGEDVPEIAGAMSTLGDEMIADCGSDRSDEEPLLS